MSYNAPPPNYGEESPYGASVPQGTNTKAIWALVTGILSLLCCGPVGIASIILGRSAQAEVAQTGQGGAGLAKAGFILGILGLALMVVYVILYATGTLTLEGTFDTN